MSQVIVLVSIELQSLNGSFTLLVPLKRLENIALCISSQPL